MIKIYLDWNVMAQLKGGFQNDLLKIITDKDKFLIPYSTSHIGDILSSYSEEVKQKKRIEKDLEFISSLTDNLCLSNNGKKVIFDYSDPKILFQQRVEDKDFLQDFTLDKLGESFGDDEQSKELGKGLISLLKLMPLDVPYKTVLENPESSEYIDVIFPGLKENQTLEGFFNSFAKMFKNLNEKEDYKTLREVAQKGLGINRDKIYDNINPYSIIDNAHNNLGFSYDKFIDNSKNAPEWFNKISNEYLMLDMHGYQEDTVSVKDNKRKETFKNTMEDAFHSAFASTCNFYIINDNKSYKKTKQIYERLGVNTLVFKPNEFIDYFHKFLNNDNIAEHFTTAVEIMQTSNFFESQVEDGTTRIYFFPYFLFDFFNKIIVFYTKEGEPPIILLSKFSQTNGNITFSLEVKLLVKKLNAFLGYDIENKGEIKDDEILDENWSGRIWKLDDIFFKLIAINGYFQFYFNFHD
jgi:hypothetical protein